MIPSLIGKRPPSATLATLRNGELVELKTDVLFAHGRAVVVGAPGAFTPVCHAKHLPDFVANAPRLREAGVDLIACITPNDAWVNAAWSREIDPEGRIMMLSDGNLDFARGLGLTTMGRELHIGERSSRYLMQLNRGLIERISVERSILNVACTLSNDLIISA